MSETAESLFFTGHSKYRVGTRTCKRPDFVEQQIEAELQRRGYFYADGYVNVSVRGIWYTVVLKDWRVVTFYSSRPIPPFRRRR